MNVPDKVGILHIFGAVITNFKPAQTGTGPAFSHLIGTLGLINCLLCLLWDNWFQFAFDEWLMPLGGEEAHDYRHRKNFKASLTIMTNDKINMVKHTSSQAMGLISVCRYKCLQQQIW